MESYKQQTGIDWANGLVVNKQRLNKIIAKQCVRYELKKDQWPVDVCLYCRV